MVSCFRLAAVHALFFSLIYVVLFGSVYRYIVHWVHEMDLEVVRQIADEYQVWYRNGGTQMLERRINDRATFQGDRMFARVIHGDGTFVFLSRKNDSQRLKSAVLDLPATVEAPRINIGGEVWSVSNRSVDDTGAHMLVGKDVNSGELTLKRLREAIIMVFFPAILTGALGSAFLSYRALQPVRAVSGAMRDIVGTGDLSHRVAPISHRGEMNEIVDLFNQVLDKNQQLVAAMRDSLDNVAHDFRTPLTRLHITVERSLGGDATPEELRETLIDCLEQSEHLDRLLWVLMEISFARSGVMNLRLERFSLSELIRGVVELYELVAEEKGITIDAEIGQEWMIRADKIRMGQVLANLVDNAIKFTTRGMSILIEVERDGEMGRVAVKDAGSGIPEKDLPFIWDRLYRTESSR